VMLHFCCTAVESSCEENMKPPSPETDITFEEHGGDCVREAAMAQGRPTPRVCWPSELMRE
jgi:hypothetical protein